MTPAEIAKRNQQINQHTREIRRLLGLDALPVGTLMLNINAHTVQSWDWKIHGRLQKSVDSGAQQAQT